MSYGAYSLAKHCASVRSMQRAQSAYDNMEPPEYWEQEEECIEEEPDYEAMIESKADRNLEKSLAMEWGGIDR